MNMQNRENELLSFLRLVGKGEMLALLHENMLALERAVADTGKAGEVTVKFKVAPNGGAKRLVTFGVKSKLPEIPPAGTYLFATQQGQLVENDPDQMIMPLRTVENLPPPVRTVDVTPVRVPVPVAVQPVAVAV